MKRLRYALLVVALVAVAIFVIGYRNATSDPIIRVAQLEAPELSGSKPLRILLLADTHVQAPDMTPERLTHIVRELNALKPDLVLIGGDYTSDKFWGLGRYPVEEAIRPLGDLRAPLGVVAVLGNHDRPHAEAVQRALAAAGITPLKDEAKQFGPIAIGGIFERTRRTVRRLMRLQGLRIVLVHQPDRIALIPPLGLLTLAAHTHCGQMVLPVIGPLSTGTQLPDNNICGLSRFGDNALLVTSGLGTSRVPLRYGAPPDVWLIIVRPAEARSADAARRI
jgi:predicted MPP superfamily phosphohydrolase